MTTCDIHINQDVIFRFEDKKAGYCYNMCTLQELRYLIMRSTVLYPGTDLLVPCGHDKRERGTWWRGYDNYSNTVVHANPNNPVTCNVCKHDKHIRRYCGFSNCACFVEDVRQTLSPPVTSTLGSPEPSQEGTIPTPRDSVIDAMQHLLEVLRRLD